MFHLVALTERKVPAARAGSFHRVGAKLGVLATVSLGLLLGLLGYGKAPKTLFRLPGLIRKKPLYYGL